MRGRRERARGASVIAAWALAVAAVAAVAAAGCSDASMVPGAAPKPRTAAAVVPRRLDPADFIPADLDLVVRVDVARMRSGLGAAATDDLAARALANEPDTLLRDAAGRADVIWVGLRLAHLDEGDRVMVLEGKMRGLDPEPSLWEDGPSHREGAKVHDRKGYTPRAGVARVVAFGDRAFLFASPVEASSVGRVLRDGADEGRRDPAADGLVTLDLKAGRLPPYLERRFPSIGHIIGGLERIRAATSLSDDGVLLEAEILARTPESAGRAARFLEVLRDNARDLRYAEVMGALSIEQVERTVRVRWKVPAQVVLALLSSTEAG